MRGAEHASALVADPALHEIEMDATDVTVRLDLGLAKKSARLGHKQ